MGVFLLFNLENEMIFDPEDFELVVFRMEPWIIINSRMMKISCNALPDSEIIMLSCKIADGNHALVFLCSES